MSERLKDVVRFRGDRLFNGAVNIGWLDTNEELAKSASQAFIFHGPAYHGAQQEDVSEFHGYKLQSTARFAEVVLRRAYGLDDQPFTLAIAGYGTGKSHLGLTLSTLLRDPSSSNSEIILEGIDRADSEIGISVRNILKGAKKPCLVVAINGMESMDLTSEVTRQIILQVKGAGLDAKPLETLRPRFEQAANLVKMTIANSEVKASLLEACNTDNTDYILTRLGEQDECTYALVHQVLASVNINIAALGGESIQDVVNTAVRKYCGSGNLFSSLVVLFDEFGRYTEFATVRSHIAGSGVLQDLFEGIQANARQACFIGFIQFELNAYIQRVAPEHQNEIKRYITRYQAASKAYLSINLETLIANLIEKVQPNILDDFFDTMTTERESRVLLENIGRWFPQSTNHSLWTDFEKFNRVIQKGCWPLSAYSVWFLFYLASGGKHLQERSALALLGELFERSGERQIIDGKNVLLSPVDLWSDNLQQEFLSAEESGQHGSITHAYSSIESRHGSQFSTELRRLLRGVVIASKLGLKSVNKDDAIEAISELSGLSIESTHSGIQMLHSEYNVLEWDEVLKTFEILGDAVPRAQFLSHIRSLVASSYDESGKAKLFISKAAEWCDFINNIDCDFAEENKVTTREWQYLAKVSNFDFLTMHFRQEVVRWRAALAVGEQRGTVFYCYVEQNRDVQDFKESAARFFKNELREVGVSAVPIWAILLHDKDGVLGQSLAELAVMEESLSKDDIAKYGSLVEAHQEKAISVMRSSIDEMVKHRYYVTTLKEPVELIRLSRVGSEIFNRIYTSQISFPFDGFTTASGNAADDCMNITISLIHNRLIWNDVISMQPRLKNRITHVLYASWGVFSKTERGIIKKRPSDPTVRLLTEKWDKMLSSGDQRISLREEMMRLCAPPYGANIASAGLFLGVFIAPRRSKLALLQDGVVINFDDWTQGNFFKGKFINLDYLRDTYIVLLGESSTEWEELFDEWENAETHTEKLNYYLQSEELKQRSVVPESDIVREKLLKERSAYAIKELREYESRLEAEASKIRQGQEKADIPLLSWGAANLSDMITAMISEASVWSKQNTDEVQEHLDRGRELLVQMFPEWIQKQTLKAETPSAVADFKGLMIGKVGGNLKRLNLEDLHAKLIQHTDESIKQAETIARAHQLSRDAESWVEMSAQAAQISRVVEVKALQKSGTEYVKKIRKILDQITLPQLTDLLFQVSNCLDELKKVSRGVKERAGRLWQMSLETMDDIEGAEREVRALLPLFEGCKDDLEDLNLIQQALLQYRQAYKELSNEQLTNKDFELLFNQLRNSLVEDIGDQELPWDPSEAMQDIKEGILNRRDSKSLEWMKGLESSIADISNLNIQDISKLHSRANTPPGFISISDQAKLRELNVMIEGCLNEQKVDWVVQKFRELSPDMQKQFLSRINI